MITWEWVLVDDWVLKHMLTSVSLRGSKSSLPARAMAVTSSGEVTNAWVAGLASLRPIKLRLYEVTIVFFSPFFTS